MPFSVSAKRKFHSLWPESATATPATISATPQAMMVVVP